MSNYGELEARVARIEAIALKLYGVRCCVTIGTSLQDDPSKAFYAGIGDRALHRAPTIAGAVRGIEEYLARRIEEQIATLTDLRDLHVELQDERLRIDT